MEKFLQLLTVLLQEAKDPASLLKRLLTILVAVIIFLFVSNTSEVMSFLKTFSTSSVLQDVQTQRIDNFPNVAREKSMVLFSQTGADAVFVVKYKPDAINDYSNIIAWESNAQLDRADLADKAVNKTSELYRRHLEGFNYAADLSVKVNKYTGSNIPAFKNITFNYVYTCPYFNLNNIYAGYIGIAWKDKPVDTADSEQFNEYLAKLCSPQRRSLGRSI